MDKQTPKKETTSEKVNKTNPTEHDIVVASDRAESSLNDQLCQSQQEKDEGQYADYKTDK
jgi:hypothetical protein